MNTNNLKSKNIIHIHQVEDLFYQFVIELEKRNEIEFKNLFVDGTKIEADANRYTFVWKKTTDILEEKLQKKFKKIVMEISDVFNITIEISDSKIEVEDAIFINEKLLEIKENQGVNFVYGKGRRKSKLQKYVEALIDFIEKQTRYDDYNSIFNGRNSFSKTDHDAIFMHMKEYHMKNGQLKPGYNVQKGILLRVNRSIQVEGAFGVIKQDYGFRRFLMRGNIKVRIEVLLMAFAYNVNKLHNKTMQKRNGKLLHETDVA